MGIEAAGNLRTGRLVAPVAAAIGIGLAAARLAAGPASISATAQTLTASHPLYGCWRAERHLFGSRLQPHLVYLCFNSATRVHHVDFHMGHGADGGFEWSVEVPGRLALTSLRRDHTTLCTWRVLAFGKYLALSDCTEKDRYLAGWFVRERMDYGPAQHLQQGRIPTERPTKPAR